MLWSFYGFLIIECCCICLEWVLFYWRALQHPNTKLAITNCYNSILIHVYLFEKIPRWFMVRNICTQHVIVVAIPNIYSSSYVEVEYGNQRLFYFQESIALQLNKLKSGYTVLQESLVVPKQFKILIPNCNHIILQHIEYISFRSHYEIIHTRLKVIVLFVRIRRYGHLEEGGEGK